MDRYSHIIREKIYQLQCVLSWQEEQIRTMVASQNKNRIELQRMLELERLQMQGESIDWMSSLDAPVMKSE
ncbi:hypothetical protein QNI19_09505 [Cytophagaceae bacterium DM2B3-1]|uniref:Uncharacterized protein n=1 Tax=Xanthocytophaga flava TaxID=3048013 RepID=A0AAE3QNV6_9BACT|nr:hypothetical protein [Xanthocytophaga flavus]MDJ1470766.1 hypothetical protein [Xanthocytophaga flavus]MDJ1482535.1 hypothetical protein [Xanthocytophaga flavus]MDJ1493165.1 hypothetical protein [Xanthocytophaga flavus]